MGRFRLPSTPSWDCESPVEIADFLEILALQSLSKLASLADVRAAIARHAEVSPADDAEDDIGEEDRLDFAIQEVQDRLAMCCPTGYPFRLSSTSDHVLEAVPLGQEKGLWLYTFLLLTTRLNMKSHQILDGINAPLLFERICEAALRTMGGSRSEVHRFGTSAGEQNFHDRLKAFFTELDEYPLRTDREIPKHGGDDGLDLAVWSQFSWTGATRWRPDVGRPRGKLILLAQCKTGTSWDESDLNRLQPGTFFDKWMGRQPRGQMARAFMVSGRVEAQELEDYQAECLFLDRCRIVDYAITSLPDDVFVDLCKWTKAALACRDFCGS